MKKLIPALCMLLVAAALLGTSTFAWFSMNRTVTASSMQIKATTGSDLYILNGTVDSSGTNPKWAAAPDVATIAASKLAEITDLAVYANSMATLAPASTSDFATFFYVDDAKGIAAGGSAYATAPGADEVKSVSYSGDNLDAAKEYVQAARCYLAVQEETAKTYTSLDCKVSIAATSAKADMLNTIRVAVIVEGEGTTAIKVWSADGDDATKPLSGVTTIGAAQSCEKSGESATVVTSPKGLEVYTVTVLVWFEGQDDACVNANALNSDDYTIGLEFNLVGVGA